jgi:hypothetical protein
VLGKTLEEVGGAADVVGGRGVPVLAGDPQGRTDGFAGRFGEPDLAGDVRLGAGVEEVLPGLDLAADGIGIVDDAEQAPVLGDRVFVARIEVTVEQGSRALKSILLWSSGSSRFLSASCLIQPELGTTMSKSAPAGLLTLENMISSAL